MFWLYASGQIDISYLVASFGDGRALFGRIGIPTGCTIGGVFVVRFWSN
jgi:hypothetical protein